MLIKPILNSLVLSCLSGAVLLGCGPRTSPSLEQSGARQANSANEHDEAPITVDDVDRPADFSAAVARIKQYRDTIRDEIAAGKASNAHRPLDEMNFVIDWLPEIAQKSNVPKKDWEALNTSAQMIRQLLDTVHENIDNNQPPDFDSVADRIEKEIDVLDLIQKSNLQGRQSETDENESKTPHHGENQ